MGDHKSSSDLAYIFRGSCMDTTSQAAGFMFIPIRRPQKAILRVDPRNGSTLELPWCYAPTQLDSDDQGRVWNSGGWYLLSRDGKFLFAFSGRGGRPDQLFVWSTQVFESSFQKDMADVNLSSSSYGPSTAQFLTSDSSVPTTVDVRFLKARSEYFR